MNSVFKKLRGWVAGFARAREGNVAMMAGVALPVLLLMSAGAIDLHNVLRVKSELQDALDAASLAAARSPYTDQRRIQEVGMASMVANMPKYYLGNPGDVATFTILGKEEIVGTATVQVKTLIANTFLPPYGKLFDDYIPVTVGSEVMRASRNVEVAMALDITGSMSSYMGSLRSSAKELVSIVVQGDQDIYTTRVALVPYARAVNVGGYAEQFRGTLRGSTSITDAKGADAAVTVTSSRSGIFEASGVNLTTGDYVNLSGFSEFSNNTVAQVSSVSGSTFRLQGYSGNYTSSSSRSNNRRVRKCYAQDCNVLVTSARHGLSIGERIKISNVRGMTQINRNHNVVEIISPNQFVINYSGLSASNYSNNAAASVQCGSDGCAQRYYYNNSGNEQEVSPSDCVTERPRNGGAPSDARPNSSSWLGRAYLPSDSRCQPGTYLPLTNQLTGTNGLNTVIDSYRSEGATAGQTGIEMAWYSVSPNFGSIFPEANRPNRFDEDETIKAVILMTDGEFNTPYCQGVVSRDAGSGSVSATYQINCDSENGSVFEQSVEICRAMKNQKIVVYTIGFNLGTGTGRAGIDTAYEVMRECASGGINEYFFPAASTTDLQDAFRAIGRDITRLRIAR